MPNDYRSQKKRWQDRWQTEIDLPIKQEDDLNPFPIHAWDNNADIVFSEEAIALLKSRSQDGFSASRTMISNWGNKFLNWRKRERLKIIEKLSEWILNPARMLYVGMSKHLNTSEHARYLDLYCKEFFIDQNDPRVTLRGQRGVKANINITSGTPLGIYAGEYLSELDIEDHEHTYGSYNTGRYYFQTSNKNITISAWQKGNILSLINANTIHDNCTSMSAENVVAVSVQHQGIPYIMYMALTNINRDDELLIDYQKDYWNHLNEVIELSDSESTSTEMAIDNQYRVSRPTGSSSTSRQDLEPNNNYFSISDARSRSRSPITSIRNQYQNQNAASPEESNVDANSIMVNCQSVMPRQTIGQSFQCPTCSKNFSMIGNFKAHIRTHTGEKPFQCHICQDSFTTNGNLTIHSRKHTGEKPFQCHSCQQRFTSSGSLTAHILTHTGEKPFQCHICQQKFTVKSSLTAHIRTHTGEKPFQCHICQQKFTTNGSLTVHSRIHTGEKPFQCHICQDRFISSSHLSQHSHTHTGEKPFQCHICQQKFTTNGSLTVHSRIHTGEKPFQCHICQQRFTSSGSLTAHIRTHTGERPFQCPICSKRFITYGYASKHKKIAHSIYTCHKCHLDFSTKSDLEAHMRQDHYKIGMNTAQGLVME
jgi:uncharacterized Zn-finger protein